MLSLLLFMNIFGNLRYLSVSFSLWLCKLIQNMAKKIGRNDLCPCGSGKKYKHCCMNVEQLFGGTLSNDYCLPPSSSLQSPKLLAYLESHDVAPILDYLIALQLTPANNGKNLRLERIAQLTVSSIGKGKATPECRVFKQLIDEEYSYDIMEDIPMNMFCETVVFHGGNYKFFPGLSTHCSELFRAMTESIYRVRGVFPEAFESEVYHGVLLMLELGNAIATRAGLSGMIKGNDDPRELITDALCKQSYAISEEMMTFVIKYNCLDAYVIDSFLLDKGDPDLLTYNPERNPILYRPIVNHNGNYYFIGINNQGCSINNFILKAAAKYGCLDKLIHLTQETIWNRIGMSCIDMIHWMPMELNGFSSADAHYNESLFLIDKNWIVYLCYAKDTVKDVSVDGADKYVCWEIDKRLKKTLSVIKNNEKTKGYHILTLVLYSSMGEPFTLMMSELADTDYLLEFSAFDFLQLVQTEGWDNLSLVRYARTKSYVHALKHGLNQSLDCYAMYKRKGESFYFSDERTPDLMQIQPNTGCELIHESKKKLNFHATPILKDCRQIAYIPVQRDIDYASIYKPLSNSLNAKCCESYSVPIWVRCSQIEQEGENPSSITETVITAIAFWMDRLRPAIEERIKISYKNPIEIDLLFEEETLADKYIHHDRLMTAKEGTMTISKTNVGVKVAFDQYFIHGFMGADNAHERMMMKNIILSLLEVDDKWMQTVLDELMPLGQAKMILMMEASNSPITFPVWLYPPIYIHEASNQLVLDLFPKWMESKGYDITGRLSTLEQKNAFLRNGVDVLLEQLDKHVGRFDSHSLLKRLINNHETMFYQREHNKTLHPAQVICFGDDDAKRKEFFETERQLSNTGLATRVLIEYVSATQGNSGHEIVGDDDVETLLAIASEIVHIGGICDAVHLGVSEHTIEKLESGRYGIYDDNFSDSVSEFASARSVEAVNNQMEDFASKMEHLANLQPRKGDENDAKWDEIDGAFFADWGVSYRDILRLLYSCYLLAMKLKCSIVELTEDAFLEGIIDICPELSADIIEKGLEHLTIYKRMDYLTPPEGMSGKDIYPWVYNRELSYLRRPIVRWQMNDGIKLMYGFRACLAAGMQLTDLLYSGRLKYGGKKIEKLLGKFESAKGAAFNEEVRTWLQDNTTLKVWEYEVSIKPRGNFIASDDLGDIDVLAYDTSNNVVYSIECKNTNTAKNVREMKKEMDDYLGREGKKKGALVLKHLKRHKWLQDNIDKLRDFLGAKTNPIVKSMMLTSEVIPTSYLRKEETPLSILNYQELKRNGVAYLAGAK